MNRPFLSKVVPQGFVLAGLLLVGAGSGLAQNPPPLDANSPSAPAGQRTDGQIEMDVVHALDSSSALKDDLITAATIQGVVSLSGTVSTEASKELAESIVAHVSGVTKVTNNLNVGNPQDAQAGPPPQEDNQADDQQAPAPSDSQQAQAPPQQAPYPSQDQGQYQNQGQYPDQNQANGQPPPPPYPPARPQYAPAPYPPAYPPQGQYAQQGPPPPQYREPSGPVSVPQGTLLQVRTSESLDNKRAKDGSPVQFTVIRDVAIGGVLAIPKGATVHGVVTESKRAGELGGSAELALRLTSLDLGGRSYDLDTDQFKVKGPNKAGETVGNAVGGGIIGTIIGCAVGRGVGCAVGAGAGVAAGVGATAASGGPRAWIPAEALVTFHLNTPLTVDPVSSQEAARLAQGLYQGGPNLYRRRPYAYGPYGPGPYGGAYAYGPVYYRPYYIAGGEYYWR